MTPTASELLALAERHRFMPIAGPDFDDQEKLADWLNSVSSAAFLVGAREFSTQEKSDAQW